MGDTTAGWSTSGDAAARLTSWVMEDFGVELVSAHRIRHGADAAAELWCAVASDGGRYAVKLDGAGRPAGTLVPVLLAGHGVAGVPAPLSTLQGSTWSTREGRRLSLSPWLHGDRALDRGLRESHWRAFGELMARVHATEAPEALRAAVPSESHLPEQVLSAVSFMDGQVAALLKHGVGAEGMRDPLVRVMVQGWRSAAPLVRTLVAGADELGRRLGARSHDYVLCHGDPHSGNLIVEGTDRVWLVDWDDAVFAPRERDLMFVLHGVLAFAPVTTEQESWFFDGYGPAELDPERLAYYRCTRALVDLVDPVAQVLAVEASSGSDRADALRTAQGVLSPTGLVRLAVTSLRELGLAGDEAEEIR